MRIGSRLRYIGGAVIAAAAAALVLVVFSLLSVTDKADAYLADTRTERHGWRYELLADGQVRAWEPVFESEYALAVPEGTEAVRISRVMTEELFRAELEWMRYLDGVEVFLSDELLYTDFPQLARDDEGFVHPRQDQWDQICGRQAGAWRHIRMSLPEDYLGQELAVVTYFPPDSPPCMPEYPFLGSEDSYMAEPVVTSVRYNAVMTVYAILALVMAGVFLLDIYNRNGDGRTLLLCLFYLLLFLKEAYGSEAGYFSVLRTRMDLRFLCRAYMAPLYLYLVLRMKSRWKWPLCGAVGAWAAYECAREFLRLRQSSVETADIIGPGALAVLALVAAALCAESIRQGAKTRQEKQSLLSYGILTAAVTALYALNRARAWGGAGIYLRDGIWQAVRMGNYGPIVSAVTDIVSYVTLVAVVTEVVRRTMQNRRTMDVLRERGRQTMESYERLLASEDAAQTQHHEMRHHMTALSGILQSGDLDRARRYVDAVVGDMDQLPIGRYSQNMLVNVIAGNYLNRARAQWIRVEHHLNVPPELNIADEDLSVFLSNMLQNALEACERMGPDQERYIRVDMRLREKFLFIRCVNSAPAGEQPRPAKGHGYGLAAMRAIAEKYDSVLVIDQASGTFSVMSDLCLH